MISLQPSPMDVKAQGDEPLHGSLVALEGAADQVSTQLRLLPPSTKVLIIPSLRDRISQPSTREVFNARSFVRDVHIAFAERSATARSFLRSSTSTQPRLAFVNGGCVTARTVCITAICERLTNGEIREAEAIFQEIVKDGVAGLMAPDEEHNTTEEHDDAQEVGRKMHISGRDTEHTKDEEHPSAVAMKAADSLDRNTVSLQPGSLDDDDYYENSVEDNILDSYHEGNPSQDERKSSNRGMDISKAPDLSSQVVSTTFSPEVVDINEIGDVVRRTVITMPTEKMSLMERRSKAGLAPLTPFTARTDFSDAKSYPDVIEEGDGRVLSPSTHNRNSFPSTPAVVYGEAYLVEMQSAAGSKKPLRKVRSVDRFYPLEDFKPSMDLISRHALKHAQSVQCLRSQETEVPDAAKGVRPHGASRSFESLPRTMFVKASQTVIKKSPTLKIDVPCTRVYVDRATDAGEPEELMMIPIALDSTEADEPREFEPVFPVVEDLIIHFTGQGVHDIFENEIFEAVIRSYKDGSYPVLPTPEMTVESAASNSSVLDDAEEDHCTPTSHTMISEVRDESHYPQEIDPYNPDSYALTGGGWPLKNTKNFDRINAEGGPLTPATTPPPVQFKATQKFHELSLSISTTPIGLQNSLRAILNIHFPPETTNYSQHAFSVENDRFWKPIFRYDTSSGVENRTVDQIIAIGCEDGVKQEFFNEITGQVERMGTKKSGITRSARLDIRYFIALAMQYYTASNPSQNPLTNPHLLSTLLVPHLEAYLSANPATGLLILTYPATHLATVLSLRRTLGADLLKIAGIIDSLASDPPPSHTISPLSNESTSVLNRRHGSLPSPSSSTTSRRPLPTSFARANFLLPSSASPAEISTFLQTILSTLVEKSDFYLPEPPSIPTTSTFSPLGTPPPTTDRPRTSASASSLSSLSKSNLSKAGRMLGNTNPTSTRIPIVGARSGSRSRSGTAGSERTRERERERQSEIEWESFYVGGESEDDEMDRILMPRVVKRTDRKASSRKALKFLGLA